jgi:hypothetical protein
LGAFAKLQGNKTMKQFLDFSSLPAHARYLGSTEGPGTMAEDVADAIDEAIEPVYIREPDGSRAFFDLKGA